VSTAGLVIVMTQTSNLLWSYVEKNLITRAWRYCQELLAFDKTNSGFNQDLLRYLWRLNETISDRGLQNDCSLAPKSTPAMVTGRNWNLDADRNLTCIDQSTNGMASTNYLNSDVNPRTTYADFTGPVQRSATRNPAATVHPATVGANPSYGQPSSSIPSMNFTQPAPISSLPFSDPLLTAGMADNQQALAPGMSFNQGQPTFNMAPGLPSSTNPGFATSNATSEPDAVLMSALKEILGPAANIWEPWP
ncbi:hypothetical protein ACHAQJ_009959, partial [Trichoderma viride]